MPQESSAKDATVLCTKGCPRCIKKRAETAKKNHLLQLFQNASLKTMNPSPAMYRPQLRFKKRCSRSSMRQQECKVQRPAGFRASILSMVHYETAVWMQCSCESAQHWCELWGSATPRNQPTWPRLVVQWGLGSAVATGCVACVGPLQLPWPCHGQGQRWIWDTPVA